MAALGFQVDTPGRREYQLKNYLHHAYGHAIEALS